MFTPKPAAAQWRHCQLIVAPGERRKTLQGYKTAFLYAATLILV